MSSRDAFRNVSVQKHAIADAMVVPMPGEIHALVGKLVQSFHERQVEVVVSQDVMEVASTIRFGQLFQPTYGGVNGTL